MQSIDPLIVFEVTPRCNLSCCYCYNVWKSGNGFESTELSISEIAHLVDFMEAAHPLSVTLTGGEPLVREDLAEIAELFKKKGISVGVATNGILLDRESAHELADAGVRWFEVSIPSITRDGYLNLTGIDGLEQVKQAMLAAKSTGARLSVSHIMTALNEGEAGKVIELAFAFSADSVALNRFVPIGEVSRNSVLLPSIQQLDNTLRIASDTSASLDITVYASIPVEGCILKHERYPGIKFGSCVCGKEKWAVDPSGNLRICEQSPQILGSCLEYPFEELVQKPEVRQFRESNRFNYCRECPVYDKCGGGCRFF